MRYLETRLSASNEELTRRLAVGPKTVTNDVKELNRLLAGTGTIELENGRYRLFIADHDGFGRARGDISGHINSFSLPPNRHGFIFRRLLAQTAPILIDDLALEMNVGRSTVVGDLSKLKEMLSPYFLRITGTPNVGIEMSGDELQLRFFIIENMYEATYSDYPLDDDLLQIIEDAAAQYHLDGATSESFTRWFTVMLDRVLTEHPLTGMPSKYLGLKTTPAFELADQVVNAIGRRIQTAIPASESMFLALPIAGMRTPADERALQQFPLSAENEGLVQKILDEIGAEMDLHVPASGLLKEFVHHITFMQNRMKYHIYLKDLSLLDIELEYPVAYRMARVAKRVIEQETNLVVIEDELGFIASYFQVFLEEQQVKSEPGFRVAIVSTSGMVPARLIRSQLEKVMSGKTEYQIIPLSAADRETLDGFDLVVSTAWSKLETSSSILELSEFFDNREIRRQIDQLRYEKQVDISIAGSANSLLVSILDQTRFFRLSPERSYLENTATMIDCLVETGALDQGFKARFFAREMQSTMQLDEYVGFPHLANAVGTRVVFAMGVIPRTRGEFGERVIFLMGLPDKADYDDTMLVKIYDEIIRLAANRSELDAISTLTSYEQFFFHMAKAPLSAATVPRSNKTGN